LRDTQWGAFPVSLDSREDREPGPLVFVDPARGAFTPNAVDRAVLCSMLENLPFQEISALPNCTALNSRTAQVFSIGEPKDFPSHLSNPRSGTCRAYARPQNPSANNCGTWRRRPPSMAAKKPKHCWRKMSARPRYARRVTRAGPHKPSRAPSAVIHRFLGFGAGTGFFRSNMSMLL
jgi:hypothetical protein